MSTSNLNQSPAPQNRTPSVPELTWHSAYMAALFENDHSQLERRIRFAAQAILQRQRELLAENSDSSERRALNNALNALRVLRDFTRPKRIA